MSKLLILTLIFLVSIGFVSALNTQVLGKVIDGSDKPIVGADVVVTCNSISKTTTTALDGSYIVSYPQAVCGFNVPVHVVATLDSQTGENDGLTCANANDCYGIPIALVNITVPEFTAFGGAAVLLAGLGIIALRRK